MHGFFSLPPSLPAGGGEGEEARGLLNQIPEPKGAGGALASVLATGSIAASAVPDFAGTTTAGPFNLSGYDFPPLAASVDRDDERIPRGLPRGHLFLRHSRF